ncbi:valine--tRNA ligase [Candidatus Woesearchaeota archaeon]|nr:valine--tRNA ligase [Candidatus Woesearchaeota archaeon]
MQLPKHYEAKEVEAKWQKYWEKEKLYKFDSKSKKPIYSIDVPPPYASAGHLHVGHALHYTQFEIMARYKRMNGFNVYFAPCFDNNGLPTEKYVEEKYKISKKDTTRAEFRKLCRKESAEVEKAYADKVFRALGHSYDWDLLYTTISPEAQKVAQMSFLDLYSKGECYRGEEPTIWCTHHQTALAQAEVEDVQRKTKLNYINFDLVDGGEIEIATTRPEFLPMCVGIFVHSDDKRYKKLIGKEAIVPVFGQKVKIRADEKVDKEFGSGIVMVCTFGDNTDIEWWKKHKLDLKMGMTGDGKLNELAGKFKGLSLEQGREEILAELERESKLVKQEELEQTVGGCWRCKTPVEYLVTKQWFIRTLKHKKELIKQAKKVKWYPDFYFKRFEDWTNNLGWDWIISRQRFYGVPMPVWYCSKCGEVFLPDKKSLPVDPSENKPKGKCKCGSADFEPELDVFDTWMTSSMSPEISARWLEKPEQFKKLFPMSLRPQSHDIIRTWAFYTILKAFLHFKSIPWKDIAIGTYVLDEKRKGMHKSLGNVVWTDDLLKEFDVDTVRYWVGTATFGEDLPFQKKDLITGQRFLTKLWNASKFGIMHLEDYKKHGDLEVMDKWLLTKLNKVILEATKFFDEYQTGKAKRAVEEFVWFMCDNYLEIVKDRLYNPDKRGKEARQSAQYGLYQMILDVLKMMAPMVPHITEEIYHLYFDKKEKVKSIHISDWPKADKKEIDLKSEEAGDIAVDIISAVRKFKASKNLSLKAEIAELILHSEKIKGFEKKVEMVLDDIKAATHAVSVKFGKEVSLSTDRLPIEIEVKLA